MKDEEVAEAIRGAVDEVNRVAKLASKQGISVALQVIDDSTKGSVRSCMLIVEVSKQL